MTFLGSRFLLMAVCVSIAVPASAQRKTGGVPYGNNTATGAYLTVAGAAQYYEVYGEGQPLVLIHGNGGNIAYMKPQIEYFARKYRVIVVDCRGRGRSELGRDSLTYSQMAEDIASILRSMKVDSAYVVGRSDGGILALLLSIHYPRLVKKAVAFAANCSPDTIGLYPWYYDEVVRDRTNADEMLARRDTTQKWRIIQQRNRLMEFQPHISAADLRRITCPVLVMSTDRDIIPEEHTLWVYRNIAKANLCFLPGENHYVSSNNPNLFNDVVGKYLETSYRGEEARR